MGAESSVCDVRCAMFASACGPPAVASNRCTRTVWPAHQRSALPRALTLTLALTTTLTAHAPVELLGPNMATNSSSGSFQNVTSDRNPTPDMGATTARLCVPSDTLTSAVPER